MKFVNYDSEQEVSLNKRLKELEISEVIRNERPLDIAVRLKLGGIYKKYTIPGPRFQYELSGNENLARKIAAEICCEVRPI